MPFGLIGYALLALAVMGMIGTGVYKVKKWGAEEVRSEWAAANVVAQQKADADRKRQEAIREAEDKATTKRLSDAKKRQQALMASLEAHIRVANLPRDCRITPELLGDANRALEGGQSVSTSPVPSKPGAAAPARRPNP